MTELDPDKMVEIVSRVTDVGLKILLSDDRHKHIATARFAAYFVLREAGFSYPVIGKSLARDHTTAMAGFKKAAILHESSVEFQRTVRIIKIAVRRAKESQMPAPPSFEEFSARCLERLESIKASNDQGTFAQLYYEDVSILLKLIQSKNETPEILYQRSV